MSCAAGPTSAQSSSAAAQPMTSDPNAAAQPPAAAPAAPGAPDATANPNAAKGLQPAQIGIAFAPEHAGAKESCGAERLQLDEEVENGLGFAAANGEHAV